MVKVFLKKNSRSNFGKNKTKNYVKFKRASSKFNIKRKKIYGIKKSKFFFTKKGFRVYDSIVSRRSKLLRKVRNLNFETYSNLFLKYPGLRWIKDFKLVSGFFKYKKFIDSLESQGLKRKLFRRRLSNFAVALQDKQKLKMFYLGLKEYKLKSMFQNVFACKINIMDNFIGLLESRLSIFLFRLNISKNFKIIFFLIKMGFIKVNNEIVRNINYMLKPEDVVSLSIEKNKHSFFMKNFEKRMCLFFYPSNYIECSFVLLSFIYYKKPRIADVPFSFNINFNRVLSFYNYKGLR
jgi:ribosomal protein S4